MSDHSDATSDSGSTTSLLRENVNEGVQGLQEIGVANDVAHSLVENTNKRGDYENTSESGSDARGDVPNVAKEEPLTARENLETSLDYDVEGLSTLWDLLPSQETSQDSVPPEDLVPVDFDVVLVHGFFGSRQSPWENPGAGSSKWLHAWRNRDCRVMNFQYDASNFLSGIRSRRCIRRLATKLLDDLKDARHESAQKRTILFVAHDLGGMIVKDALTVSGLNPALYAEIFDFTRIIVFYGCPHRSLDDDEMEDKLTRFLYRPGQPEEPKLHPSGKSTRALARALIDINQLYMDSKHMFRCYIFSISAETDITIDKVFDHYTGTMGVPFEARFTESYKGDGNNIESQISQLGSLTKVNVESTENERTLLSVASPLSVLKSGAGPSHTFSWISNNKQYKSWYNQRKPQLLYLCGNSNTQSAAEYVFYDLDNLRREKSGQVVVYFSFDQYDNRRHNIQHMLATLQAQVQGHFPTIATTFNEQLRQHWLDRSLHLKDLIYWFKVYNFFDEVEGISCVLNHFDECEPTSRELFLGHLRYMSQNQERPFRVLVTSRQPGALLEELSSWSALDLDQSAYQLNQNFSTLSYRSLYRLHSNVRGFREEFELEIRSIDKLEPDAQNLIVQHIVQDERWPSEISIRDKFGPLQTITMELAIGKILDDVPDKSFILQALTLILYAVRPPTIWELAAITHQNSLDLSLGPGVTDDVREKLNVWLAGIVTVSQTEALISSRRIREALLAELSNVTGQSLMAGCLTPKLAHANLAKYCLHYLSSETAKPELENLYDITRNAGPHIAMSCDRTSMLYYATAYWVHHFRLTLDSRVCDDGLAADLESFCESGAVSPWSKALWVLANPFTRSRQPAESLYPILTGAGLTAQAERWCCGDRDLSAGIVEASFNGLVQTVRSLLPRSRYSVDTLQETLIGAGSYGDEAAWFELITNIRENYPEFPWAAQITLLCRASWLGQEKVLNQLLELGCPADEKDLRRVWGQTPLKLAVYMNHLTIAKVLLECGANPKQVSPIKRTLIHTASSMGHAEMVKLLWEYGTDLDAKDEDFMTAIYLACLWANYKVAKVLISLGADPNIKATENQDEPAWSPLICAIFEENIDCAHAVLSTDVDIKALGVKGVPLRYAVNYGLLGICQELLDRGVDPNDHPLSPPILVCAAASWKPGNRLNVIKLLIEKGARVNDASIYKETALWLACLGDDPQMLATVALLLEHGADINFQTEQGSAPLHVAASQGNVELLELLVKTPGVNLNILDGDNETPLVLACTSEGAARVLLEAGANPDSHPGNVCGPLIRAIEEGSEEVVRLLIQHNARIEPPDDLRDISKWEPLELAVNRGRSSIVRILADGGANINRLFYFGRSLVHLAMNSEALGALLEFRPKLDVQDDNGYGPLHYITSDTPVENVKLLVRAGVNINLVNIYNSTPLIEALRLGNEGAADYLLSKNASLDIISPDYGGVLHAACSSGMVGMVKRFISFGTDVNMAVDGLGGSPLSALFNDNNGRGATPEMQREVLDILIEAGADVEIPTGLHFGTVGVAAAWGGTDPSINKLISKGASFVAKDTMGRQPLHIAAVRGDMDVFTTILNASNGTGERDHCGRNIVSWAAQSGSIEMLEKVLQLLGNESINEKDETGWTPLCWVARGLGVNTNSLPRFNSARHRVPSIDLHKAIITLLLEKGADKSVKSGIKGKEYTPEGIATYHNHPEAIVELLALDTNRNTGERDGMPPRRRQLRSAGGYCDFCLFTCWGIRHNCKTCPNFCFCYKCFELKHKIHPPSHEFEEFGIEFEPSSEISPSRRSHSASEDTDSSSSSGSEDEGDD
ncbi:ankyrin repeat-containing domain protein [Nemania sp. FL0031]|nr:ankyrin repeat-containing domain protein [Nemania sp. FL0031]